MIKFIYSVDQNSLVAFKNTVHDFIVTGNGLGSNFTTSRVDAFAALHIYLYKHLETNQKLNKNMHVHIICTVAQSAHQIRHLNE